MGCPSISRGPHQVFPTDVRATFHGAEAACGKVGAIVADVAFGYVWCWGQSLPPKKRRKKTRFHRSVCLRSSTNP